MAKTTPLGTNKEHGRITSEKNGYGQAGTDRAGPVIEKTGSLRVNAL